MSKQKTNYQLAKERQRGILADLERFRVLDRDQLIKLYFEGNSQDVVVCNRVMRRLIKKGYVSVNKTVKPYDYFLNPSPIKHNSTKLLHFKAIADFYIELCKYKRPTEFRVEYFTYKGGVIPDVFMVFMGIPIFVEVQRSVYHQPIIQEKYDKYVEYYESHLWKKEYWQPKDQEPIFPAIWMISDKTYTLPDNPVEILQTKTIKEFINKHVI